MATRRRDTMVGKEKKTIPSLTPVRSTKTSLASITTTPVSSKPRSVTRADVSKKTSTVDKTKAPLERKSLSLPPTIKTATTPKATRVSTNPPSRTSSLSSRTLASQKPAQDINKNVKAPVRPAGSTVVNRSVRPVGTATKPKQGSQVTTSVTNLKQGSRSRTPPVLNTKKQGSLNAILPKGRSTSLPPKKVEPKIVCTVNYPDPDFFLDGLDDSEVEDLRSNDGYDFEENGFGFEMVGDVDTPFNVKTEVVEEKQCIEEEEEEVSELEKHTTDEVNSVSDDANGEMEGEIKVFGEQESDSEVAVPEQEIDEEEKQESENESAKQEIIEEKKPEPAGNALRRFVPQMKKCGSTVSNDAIEETATKLREQRKNKVLALAKAFESVMTSP